LWQWAQVEDVADGLFEEITPRTIQGEQLFDLGGRFGIRGTSLGESQRPLLEGQIEDLLKETVHAAPEVRRR
jgi:hypothetical protein